MSFKVKSKMLRLLLIIVISVSACESQSACSDIFQYVNEGGETQGLITFDNPDAIAEIHLKIQLSIAVPLTSVSGKTTWFCSIVK